MPILNKNGWIRENYIPWSLNFVIDQRHLQAFNALVQ